MSTKNQLEKLANATRDVDLDGITLTVQKIKARDIMALGEDVSNEASMIALLRIGVVWDAEMEALSDDEFFDLIPLEMLKTLLVEVADFNGLTVDGFNFETLGGDGLSSEGNSPAS